MLTFLKLLAGGKLSACIRVGNHEDEAIGNLNRCRKRVSGWVDTFIQKHARQSENENQ